jgi:hypothetical protein
VKRTGFLVAMLYVIFLFSVVLSAIPADAAGELQTGKPRTGPRFKDNSNGTITDNLTGLVWLKKADCFGAQTWANAIASASGLANGQCGLTDGSKAGQWRLPSREELQSLINYQQASSADWLNLQGFSKVQSNFYWSSTDSEYSSNIAWFADLHAGGMYSSGTSYPYFVWPVRDGQ